MKLNDSYAAYVGSGRVRRIYKGATKVFEAPWAMEELAFYHDLQTADAAYETLPGNTLATAQNDGIGAVLDLKRYKERGAELVTTPEIQGLPISDPEDTTAASNYDTGADVEAGKVYEIEYTVANYAGTENVGFVANVFPLAAVTRQTGNGTWKFIAKATATGSVLLLTRKCNTADFSGVSVREIPGYHATQDVAANQPVLNIENGIRSALFDGVDDRLVIPNSTGAFNFLHDGTGGEAHFCLRYGGADSTGFLFMNLSSLTGTAAGVALSILANGRIDAFFGDGSGGFVDRYSGSGAVEVGKIVVVSVASSTSGVRIYVDNALAHEGAFLASPSQGDAVEDATIGARPNGMESFSGDTYSIAVTQGILAASQRQRLVTYMLRRAGA